MARIIRLSFASLFLTTAVAGIGDTRVGWEEQGTGSIESHLPEQFERFRPVTVLDAVLRIPGFVFNDSLAERGIGASSGNVLVDGKQPVTKRMSLSEYLGQIPFSSMTRIEVVSGTSGQYDMQGQSVIANVVLDRSSTSRIVELNARYSERHNVLPGGTLALSGKKSGLAYSLSANREVYEDVDFQSEHIMDGAGALLERRLEEADIIPDEWRLGASLEAPIGAWSLRSNNSLSRNDFEFSLATDVYLPGSTGLFRTERTLVRDDIRQFETAGDLFRAHESGSMLKYSWLYSRQRLRSDQAFRERLPGGQSLLRRQRIADDATESALRGSYAWPLNGKLNVEIGAEVASNVLDSDVGLSVDTGAGPENVDLPVSNVQVSELRSEGFIRLMRSIGAQTSLELGVEVEYSDLEQSGDSNDRRQLTYIKPRLAFAVARGTDQYRVSFHREVAQLDFTDFVSSSTLAEQTTDLGNSALIPQNDWVLTFDWERRFSDAEAVRVLFEHRWLRDVQELIPLDNAFDAPGNIGHGTLWRFTLDASLSLQRLRLPNTLLEFKYVGQDSDVRDPVTGVRRRLPFTADEQPFSRYRINLDLRVDRTRESWGLTFDKRSSFRQYRINEFRVTQFGGERINLYAETSRWLGATFRIEAGISEPSVRRERQIFSGTRLAGHPDRVEINRRRPEKHVVLSFEKTW